MEPPKNDSPWSIPIRDAGPDVPHRTATWVHSVPALPVAVGAVLVFVAMVAAVIVLGEDPSSPTPEVLGGEIAGSTTAPPVAPEEPTTTMAPSTSTTTEAPPPASTTSTTSTATATTMRTDGAEPAGLPIRAPGEVAEGWVAQVSSVPSSAGGSALARAFETVRATVPDAVILRGGEWASLRDGFFVVVETGFTSAAAAVDGCDASGRTGRDECFARFLTQGDGAQRTCWRDESGDLAGDCT